MKGCDIIFHCAALTDLSKEWNEFYNSNVLGTRNIIEAAIKVGIKKIVEG